MQQHSNRTALAFALIWLAAGNGVVLADDTVERGTVVSQGLTNVASDAGKPVGKAESRSLAKPIERGHMDRLRRKAASPESIESVNEDFWIFDASTTLRDDFDGDGHYTRLELTFDADTVYQGANVYAVLYLSLEGGDWAEYGETLVFDIYGSSGNDEYFYDTDLVTGFPRGYYDVLIELYDDYDQRLVAVFGPSDSADLFDLPLESQATDGPVTPVVVISDEGGGGSSGPTLLALLALLGSVRAVVRRQRLRIAD